MEQLPERWTRSDMKCDIMNLNSIRSDLPGTFGGAQMASEDELVYLVDRATRIILGAHYVIGIGGAGMSVESGIRPFRGPGGLWTERGDGK